MNIELNVAPMRQGADGTLTVCTEVLDAPGRAAAGTHDPRCETASGNASNLFCNHDIRSSAPRSARVMARHGF